MTIFKRIFPQVQIHCSLWSNAEQHSYPLWKNCCSNSRRGFPSSEGWCWIVSTCHCPVPFYLLRRTCFLYRGQQLTEGTCHPETLAGICRFLRNKGNTVDQCIFNLMSCLFPCSLISFGNLSESTAKHHMWHTRTVSRQGASQEYSLVDQDAESGFHHSLLSSTQPTVAKTRSLWWGGWRVRGGRGGALGCYPGDDGFFYTGDDHSIPETCQPPAHMCTHANM